MQQKHLFCGTRHFYGDAGNWAFVTTKNLPFFLNEVLYPMEEALAYLKAQDRIVARMRRVTKDAETEFSPLTQSLQTARDRLVLTMWEKHWPGCTGEVSGAIGTRVAEIRDRCAHDVAVTYPSAGRTWATCQDCGETFEEFDHLDVKSMRP